MGIKFKTVHARTKQETILHKRTMDGSFVDQRGNIFREYKFVNYVGYAWLHRTDNYLRIILREFLLARVRVLVRVCVRVWRIMVTLPYVN